jgi:hypothetical protein
VATFLQILGLFFLGAILLILAALLALALKVRGALRQVKASLGQFSTAFQPQPATIHLNGPTTVAWARPTQAHALADPLAGLGYHDAGQFTVEEVQGLHVWPFVNPSESAYAVVYEHPSGLVWIDFVTRYEDGTSLTTSNTDQGADLDHQPGHDKDYAGGLSTAELHRRHLATRPQRPMARVSAEDFASTFEAAYAREMAWRNSRGGPTEREIRAIAERSGMAMSDEEIEETRKMMAEQAMEGLDEALRERFTATTDMRARQWEDARDSLVFVHDRLTPEMLDDRVRGWLWDGDEDDEGDGGSLPTVPDGMPPRMAFAKFNAALPQEKRFVKVGEVDQPVPADVYRAPE